MNLYHLYRAMDFLEDHKKEIEEALYRRLADLLNMDVDLVSYDTTSVHFETNDEDEELRRRGYSKNGRSDAPQIVVGMAVTRDGYPVKSWVFPGNTTDVTTIEQIKTDLRGRRLNRCIFVADAGMVSEANPAMLRRDGMWVIHSNDDSLSPEDLALAYKQLIRVEEAWRTMKSTIKIRPVFHRNTDRIRSHVFLCVLSLLLERVAEHECGDTWPCLREELRSIKIGQLLAPHGTVYQTSPGSLHARNLLKTLKIDPLPSVLAVE